MAKRKPAAIHIPSQMGFGFEVTDKNGNAPPFIFQRNEALDAIEMLENSFWVCSDSETTGLTNASAPLELSKDAIREGASNVVRMRTLQARIPTIGGRKGPRQDFVFDFDRLDEDLRPRIANAVLSRPIYIAHNAGFDLYWQRREGGRVAMPKHVADTMLLTRLLQPKLVLERFKMVENIDSAVQAKMASDVEKAAWDSLVKGGSGGALADVVLSMFGKVMDKTYQKPNNWVGLLGFEHYDYANDDTVWADRVLCNLLGIDFEGDIYEAYLRLRSENINVQRKESEVPELVYLRETGMPASTLVAERYVIRKRRDLAEQVDKLIAMEPSLEPLRNELANPDAGQSAALTAALAEAFINRGVSLRKTAKAGTYQVGEKDLRACRAAQIEDSAPLFKAWVGVCRSKKSSSMAVEVSGFISRGGNSRLHSLLSHGPVTGRLSASEPNCFTGATEILTPQGWTRFDQLQDGEAVAQYDKDVISFVKPTANIKHHFKGELVHNSSHATSLLSTLDHNCLVFNKSGKPEVHQAQTYPTTHTQLHSAFFAGGDGLSLSDLELKFLVAAAAVGEWVPDGLKLELNVPSYQTFVEKTFGLKLAEVENSKAKVVVIPMSHRLAATAMVYLGKKLSLGPWIHSLTHLQMLTLSDGLRRWSNFLSSPFKSNADWIQTAFTLSGIATRVRSVRGKSGETLWQVLRTHTSKLNGSYTHQTSSVRVPHDDFVYCVSVPSGFIVVRHDDKVMITGNCQQFPRDQLFRAICVAPRKPGCEEVGILITEGNTPFMEQVMDGTVELGETVMVDSAWAAAMFASEFKTVGLIPKEERKALEKHINSQFTHYIVASDFGALDVRVGAALCIRSQREMIALARDGTPVKSPVQPPEEVVDVLKEIVPMLESATPVADLEAAMNEYAEKLARLNKRLEQLVNDFDADRIQRRSYFRLRSEIKGKMLAVKMGWRLAQCLMLGMKRNEPEYSALRDAFVADIDIHTFTGMKLVGRDPMAEYAEVAVDDRAKWQADLKKTLGPRRQQGKIANLSLLYGMADAGFQEAAARGYDEHWTMQEAHDIRQLWMDAYPEVELWHLWTECMQAGTVYAPEVGRERKSRTGWWVARTLAEREIVALGLNAALSYQDQSSGADILGLINHRLYEDYNDIFFCSINQVHDEQVFAVPVEKFEEYLAIIEKVMVDEANSLTMPYGVPCAVSPACGPIWVKD